LGALAARPLEDALSIAKDDFEAIIHELLSPETAQMSHSSVEKLLVGRGQELMRKLFQAHLDARGAGEAAADVRGSDGIDRATARLHERGLSTVFGEVRVRRTGYGAEGVDSLHPLDAELNLPPEQYSFGLRRKAALEAAKGSFDETVASLARETGTPVPKRQVEELVQRAAVDFDAFYAQRASAKVSSTSSVLVITADAKGVVMRPADLREATRRAAARRGHKLERRLSKGEKRNAKRMATVCAVYTVAPHRRTPEQIARILAPLREADQSKRPRPENKRVWASLKKDPGQVLEEAFAEAERRDAGHRKTWVALVDGNETQIRILNSLARRHRARLTIVVDLIHVCEYLWSASLCFYAEDDPAREEWVQERLMRLLRGNATQVAAGMRRSATLRRLAPDARKAVDKAADYLLKYARYLRYDAYLRKGLPIATGVIEGACRHLVKDRMDVTGARWSLAGAEAVLRLRALRSSADFDQYWQYHEQREYERNHAQRYHAGKVVPVRRRHLQRVK
jgi:hypothetical protein